MENYIYTDLACERTECYKAYSETNKNEYANNNTDNIDFSVNTINNITVRRMNVKNEIGEAEAGTKIGKYTTIYFGKCTSMNEDEKLTLSLVIAKELSSMLPDNTFDLFISGLGNVNMTSDSVGPKVIEKLTITRHVYEYDKKTFDILKSKKTSAIAAGVLAQTGIESAEIIKSLTAAIAPEVLLTVDALCARAPERLCNTIQITDTGVSPGSGVKNRRPKIDSELLSVPVISIGFPTVMNSATMIYDCLEKYAEGHITSEMDKTLKNNVSYYVTINEIDEITDIISDIIANAINITSSLDIENELNYDQQI